MKCPKFLFLSLWFLAALPVHAQTATSMRVPDRLGIAIQLGANGIGTDIAFAVASHLNVRVGGQIFAYSSSFQEEGANVNASLRLGGGKASLDWFPFNNGLHF
jgi:hypothetical protein